MKCSGCGKEISEDEAYLSEGKKMCEDCLFKAELYPRGHIGSSRNTISEGRRRLTVWWSDDD